LGFSPKDNIATIWLKPINRIELFVVLQLKQEGIQCRREFNAGDLEIPPITLGFSGEFNYN